MERQKDKDRDKDSTTFSPFLTSVFPNAEKKLRLVWEESKNTVKKLENDRKQFEEVEEVIRNLPDSLSHDIMVPIGEMGFMCGKLKHTNEILVLLGDNYFVKRSATQSLNIITRRLHYVDEKIEAEKKKLEEVKARLSFFSDLSASASEYSSNNIVNIVEEYHSDEDKADNQSCYEDENEHEARLKRVLSTFSNKDEKETANNEERLDYLTRLLELEEQESDEEEREDEGFEESNINQQRVLVSPNPNPPKQQQLKASTLSPADIFSIKRMNQEKEEESNSFENQSKKNGKKVVDRQQTIVEQKATSKSVSFSDQDKAATKSVSFSDQVTTERTRKVPFSGVVVERDQVSPAMNQQQQKAKKKVSLFRASLEGN